MSTEPETVLSLADRILVMKKGEIVARIRRRGRQQGSAAGGRMTEDKLHGHAERRGRSRTRRAAAAISCATRCATSRPSSPCSCSSSSSASRAPRSPRSTISANILTQVSVTGIIAVGLTFVILCAEIDLSVAAIANATGIVRGLSSRCRRLREHRQRADARRDRDHAALVDLRRARPRQRLRRDAASAFRPSS